MDPVHLPWGACRCGWPDGADLFALGRDFSTVSFGAGGYTAIYQCISGLYPRLDGVFSTLEFFITGLYLAAALSH
jgi:hypothetical protein